MEQHGPSILQYTEGVYSISPALKPNDIHNFNLPTSNGLQVAFKHNTVDGFTMIVFTYTGTYASNARAIEGIMRAIWAQRPSSGHGADEPMPALQRCNPHASAATSAFVTA